MAAVCSLPCGAVLLLLLAVCCATGRPARIFFAAPRERPSNHSRCFIVKVREDVRPATIMREMRLNATEGGLWETALHGFYHCADLNETRLAEWANDTRVEFVEEDRKFRATATTTQSVTSTLWNLDRIDQRSLPIDNRFTYTTTGKGVYIYVVDTGVRNTHEQLQGRVQQGVSFLSGSTDTSDCNGHGTHVSGTAAGTTTGVARDATIVPVRVLDCNGDGNTISIINALNWIANSQPKPGVINLSLGSTGSSAVDAAVDNVVNKGFHVVAAAGNTYVDACTFSPARVSRAITVGWTTSQDAMADKSAYGSCVDLFAPGTSIFSSYNTADDSYALESGTSMAAALTSGVVAAFLEASTSASPATVQSFVKQVATSNVLTGLGSGSPNLLLFSQGNLSSNTSSSGSTSTSSSDSNTALYWILVVPGVLVLCCVLFPLSRIMYRRRMLPKAEQRNVSHRTETRPTWDPTPANTPAAAYGVPFAIDLDQPEDLTMVTPQASPHGPRPLPWRA